MIISNAINEVPSSDIRGSLWPWEISTPAALGPSATEQLVTALPEETYQLIMREAYLFRTSQVIFYAMTGAKTRLEKAAASRGRFLMFRRARSQEASIASATSANRQLSLYERAIRRDAEAIKRLRTLAESPIEQWLRTNDAAYYAGFASESLVADWHRSLARLESELTEFIAAIRTALCSLAHQSSDTGGVSAASRAAIFFAAEVGRSLAHEVAAINSLADERDHHVQGTVFAGPFPRLPSFNLASSLGEATQLPVTFLRQHFERILGHCAELRAVVLPALLRQAQQVEARDAAAKEHYLAGVWQALHQFALAHCAIEDRSPEVAAATAELMELGAVA